MHAELFIYDDRGAGDYDPSTSLSVVRTIYQTNKEFFGDANVDAMLASAADENEADGIRRGIRAGRVGSAPDGKLSEADVRAWDCLVTERLAPWLADHARALEAERKKLPPGGNFKAYDLLIGSICDKAEYILRSHARFMEGFEAAIEAFDSERTRRPTPRA